MKIHEPGLDTFIGYLQHVQEALGRKLSEKEIKKCLQMYIKPIKVDEALKEFEK